MAPGGGMPGPGSTADVEAVNEQGAAFYAAAEGGDIDRMADVWADGEYAGSVTCVHPGWPLLRGRGPVMRSWALIMANTPYLQFFLTDTDVMIRGDMAVVTCMEDILISVGDDGQTDSAALVGGPAVTTHVFRRTGTGWRLWLRHTSPVLAAGDDEDEDEDAPPGAGNE